MKHISLLIAMIATMVMLSLMGCDKAEDSISREYPCRFFFYYQPHSTSLLFSAYRSPGMWAYAYLRVESNGRKHIMVQTNDKNTDMEDNPITTDKELRAPYLLGANSEIGLIIGCTNFSGPTAFDRCCPNCATREALSWHKEQRTHVECAVCKREYDLETGAIVKGADGNALMRYVCEFNGDYLHVGN